MSSGKLVRLFLADGTPGGLLTAEIMNWTGHVVAAPRSDLASLLKRQEPSRTGIYILLGDDPDSLDGQMAYIGEGDDVSKRLPTCPPEVSERQGLLGSGHRFDEQGRESYEGRCGIRGNYDTGGER